MDATVRRHEEGIAGARTEEIASKVGDTLVFDSAGEAHASATLV